ncbi:MAG TPA: ribosomal protein L13e [Nitrososphaerales archaeon]
MSKKSEDKVKESKTLKKSTNGSKKIEKEKKDTSIKADKKKELKSKKSISKIKKVSSVLDSKKKKLVVEVIKPVKSEVKEKLVVIKDDKEADKKKLVVEVIKPVKSEVKEKLVVIKDDKEADKKKQIIINELKEKKSLITDETKSVLQIPKSVKWKKIDNLLVEASKNEQIKKGKIETVNLIPHAVVLISKGNIKKNRKGRGFSLSELNVIGLHRKQAQKLGLSIDIRRSTGLLENVKLLKKWLAPSLEVKTGTKSKSVSTISN